MSLFDHGTNLSNSAPQHSTFRGLFFVIGSHVYKIGAQVFLISNQHHPFPSHHSPESSIRSQAYPSSSSSMADIEAQGAASQHAAGHRSSTSRARSSSSSSSSSRHNVHSDSRAGRDQAGSRGGDQSTVVSAYPSQAATPKQPSSDAEPPSSPTTATGGETEKEPPKDTDLVDWDGPEDRENPKNWSQAKKWVSIGTVSSCSFCVTCNSSIVVSIGCLIASSKHEGRSSSSVATAFEQLTQPPPWLPSPSRHPPLTPSPQNGTSAVKSPSSA